MNVAARQIISWKFISVLQARIAMRLNSLSLWPGSEAPFCTLTIAADFNDGGIDHGVFHVRLITYRIENPLENISVAPVVEPAVGGAPVAKQ